MAWDPNEKGSWAWLTKEASEHGGVKSYINDIEENARAEAHDADMKIMTLIIAGAIGIGALGKTAYDKIKQKIADRKALKQKSDAAKDALICGVNCSKDAPEDEDMKINVQTDDGGEITISTL